MTVVCGACGAENRDRARFCRGCARPLPAPGADPETPAPARPGRSRRRRVSSLAGSGAALAQDARRQRLVAGTVLAGALLAAGGWWLAHRNAPLPAPATSPGVAATEPVAPATSEQGAAVFAALAAANAASAAHAPAPSVAAREPAVPKPRPRVAAAPRPVAPQASAPAAAEPPPAPTVVQTAAQPAVQTPSPAPSVEQACAGSGNFLSRDLCRVRACRDAARSGDPVCVRYREMEAASRRDPDR